MNEKKTKLSDEEYRRIAQAFRRTMEAGGPPRRKKNDVMLQIRDYIWDRSVAYDEILRDAIRFADAVTELEVDIPRRYGRIAAANRMRDLIVGEQIPYLTEHPDLEDLCKRTGDRMSYQAGSEDYFRDVLSATEKSTIGVGDDAEDAIGSRTGREEAILAIKNLRLLP